MLVQKPLAIKRLSWATALYAKPWRRLLTPRKLVSLSLGPLFTRLALESRQEYLETQVRHQLQMDNIGGAANENTYIVSLGVIFVKAGQA